MSTAQYDSNGKIKLTSMVKTSGCAAKLPPAKLHSVIDNLPLMSSENLIEGFESADDALVYRVTDDIVSVQTVDFFPPMVDDPYTFGQVAAANALSDVYAMGGTPSVAMNLMCFPSCLDLDVMKEILTGGIDKVREAGAVIAGGHTIEDPTPKYGLCVTGFMKVTDVWSNKGAREGDAIVLTKALGCGIINTAVKAEMAEEESCRACVDSMTRLNRKARDLAVNYTIHAATDVTGFSLAGHGSEVAQASGLTVEIETDRLPVLPGALQYARYGLLPAGRYTNEDFLFGKVSFDEKISQEMKDLVFDPQTSGGLLLFMPEKEAEEYVEKYMEQTGLDCCKIIGRCKEKGDFLIKFV
ncbi:MAG: selenide, water dikinase SelD [Sphaerochaetaceae bacterium]|nr:selenide, water dikinase SelD [Sphaerochaetaceae bacterium]